jgi:hypothetical protein
MNSLIRKGIVLILSLILFAGATSVAVVKGEFTTSLGCASELNILLLNESSNLAYHE